MAIARPRATNSLAMTAMAFGLVCAATSARGATTKATPIASPTSHLFPMPTTVAKQVWFWEKVFGKYKSTQVLIHDAEAPDLIIDVIDFELLQRQMSRPNPYNRRDRELTTTKYLDRYALAVRRFAIERERAIKHGPMEQRIYQVYRRNRAALSRLYQGNVNLRSQAGLVDEFERAATRADKYLPHMERIFAREQIPTELTRIAFVESMFNTEAISKVGASGVWQFMRATAKLYMNVNHYIDERNEPMAATRGAARLLRDNYAHLKAWPLAITAYNHGAAGMARAVKTLGTNDIGIIIERHKSNTFGFASRNFYGEFLAARNIYHHHFRRLHNKTPQPTNIARITIPRPVSVHQLMKYGKIDQHTLKAHNPHILPNAYETHKYHAIPSGVELLIPAEFAKNIQSALQRIRG